jgi:hypothetical protein
VERAPCATIAPHPVASCHSQGDGPRQWNGLSPAGLSYPRTRPVWMDTCRALQGRSRCPLADSSGSLEPATTGSRSASRRARSSGCRRGGRGHLRGAREARRRRNGAGLRSLGSRARTVRRDQGSGALGERVTAQGGACTGCASTPERRRRLRRRRAPRRPVSGDGASGRQDPPVALGCARRAADAVRDRRGNRSPQGYRRGLGRRSRGGGWRTGTSRWRT